MRKLAIATALTVAFAGVAAAQTVATPVYLAPYRVFTDYEIGAAFSSAGGGIAIEGENPAGQWQNPPLRHNHVWDLLLFSRIHVKES